MNNKNISPVGWYIGSYLIRFIELENDGNFDEEARFLSWENTILIKASSIDEAYDKIEKEAKEHTHPYKGGTKGIPVQWCFEGVTELLPIYDELEDGSELMFSESTRKLKNLKKMVKCKDEFHQ